MWIVWLEPWRRRRTRWIVTTLDAARAAWWKIWAFSFHNCRWDSPRIVFPPSRDSAWRKSSTEWKDVVFPSSFRGRREKPDRTIYIHSAPYIYMRWLIRRPEGNRGRARWDRKRRKLLVGWKQENNTRKQHKKWRKSQRDKNREKQTNGWRKWWQMLSAIRNGADQDFFHLLMQRALLLITGFAESKKNCLHHEGVWLRGKKIRGVYHQWNGWGIYYII